MSSKILDKCELVFAQEVDHEKALAKQLERKTSLAWFVKITMGLSRSRFGAWLHPDSELRIKQQYPLPLYLTVVLRNLVAFFSLQLGFIFFIAIAVVAVVLYEHHWLIHNGKWRLVINLLGRRILSDLTKQEAPYAYAASIVFIFLTMLPRFLMWNRRHRRLKLAEDFSEDIERETSDTVVWPPPPTNRGGPQSI
ncbi:MAG: hypothetical protein ABIY70_24400 [Capsulimonas sp.]|uniref:hypothetical protein n=1 Tax=Capsulimonas sp. TaxID=2494211 RepID=UPI003266BF00